MIPPSSTESPGFSPDNKPWVLQLFVARGSAASAAAIVQLNRIKAEYLPPNSTIDVIDIFEEPETAEQQQVLAIPTLVRKQPLPVRRIIGDLSDIRMVLTSIGFLVPQASMPWSGPGVLSDEEPPTGGRPAN